MLFALTLLAVAQTPPKAPTAAPAPSADQVATQIEQTLKSGAAALGNSLATTITTYFGPEIKNGGFPKISQTTVIWAMQAATQPTVVSADGAFRLPLIRLGTSDVYVAVSHLRNGRGFHYLYETANRQGNTGFVEVYNTPPDMLPQSTVPKGKLIKMPDLTSKIFPGTTREWWIYTPTIPSPAYRVMVFQDGGGMKDYVPVCLDNLIAKASIPPMVAIFINPGVKANGQSDRSFEYDTLSDAYARFLLEEIFPAAAKIAPLTPNPDQRAVCGLSSGGICAFTAAWERPNEFRKVLSGVGSFTDIAHGTDLKQGGQNYPFMIRLSEPKPIRVYLQDGINDLDNQFGNWPLANQSMAKALAFKGYDYTFTLGEGSHNDKHFRAIFPDMLKWLWR